MKVRIGFVLNAPIKYSQTFHLYEFGLLAEQGYEIIIFEGYSDTSRSYPYKRIKALPNKIDSLSKLLYCAKVFLGLIIWGFIPLCHFYSKEVRSGTSFFRAFKRIWFNAHILQTRMEYLHFCFAEVAIQKELVAKAIGAKMSASLRGSDVLQYPKKNKDCYIRLWKYADKIHAVSHHVYRRAKSLGLDDSTMVTIIYDGINVQQIKFTPYAFHDPIQVVSIGRLEPVKDHFFALEVVHSLIKHDCSIHYSIIGDGSLRNLLMRRIVELELERHVKIVGAKEHKELLSHLGEFDLLLHTSVSEGLGVALLEAQASGLLTFALDAGGTEESIENNKSGWIIRERNPEVMARKIMEVLEFSPSARQDVKVYARQRIEKAFDIEDRKKAWKDFFNK